MLHSKEITTKSTWDSFLLRNQDPEYPFFQSWNWGEVQKKLGVGVTRIGYYDDKNLIAVLQIVDVKAKRGHYVYLRQGPVVHRISNLKSQISNEVLSFILEDVKRRARELGASFVRSSRFPKNDSSSNFFKEHGFIHSPLQTTDAEVCWVLDITQSEEQLLKNMRKSHRYLIKKSQIPELTITKTKDPEALKRFLPLYKKLSLRKHFVAHKGVMEEFEMFSKDNEETLYLAEYEGKIIAGAMIAFVGNTAIYRHSASDDAYKNIPASYRIQWEAIQEAKKRGQTLYNFWGIAPEGSKNHPWQGITLFKKGFGGNYVRYLPTMDLPLNFSYWKTYAIDWVSARRKR